MSKEYAYRHAMLRFVLIAAFALPVSSAAGQDASASLGIFEGQTDIGSVLHSGSAGYDTATNTYAASGSGENMWFDKDEFHFVWKKISSDDVSLTADIDILGSGGEGHSKAVLMIRQSLDSDSAYVDAARHRDGLTSLQFRDRQGGTTREVESNVSGPARLRIEKQGDRFYLWIAQPDQKLQFAGGSAKVELHSPFYVGIGVCAHRKDDLVKANFREVEVAMNAPPSNATFSTVETALLSGDARVGYVSTDHLASPGWSSDGQALTFDAEGKRQETAFAPLKTAVPVGAPLPPGATDARYFASSQTGTEQIWQKTAGGTPQQLTFDNLNNTSPFLSPDGKSPLLLTYSGDLKQLPDNADVTLRLMSVADNSIKVLTEFSGGKGSLGTQPWSPDGKRVTFISYQSMNPAPAPNCESLAKLSLPDTTINLAQMSTSGAFTPPGGKPIPNLPNFCRVVALSKPSPDSDIEFEVWMPASGWNGKFQGVGNGGFAGAIDYEAMANAVANGYAAASTNTGHNGDGVDAGWALGHPEKIIDFGYRAIHMTAANGKSLAQAFYGSTPKRSYFSSCSNGGRQALMEAQRYPDDYDGIIAGAPANYWTHLLTNGAWDVQALLARPTEYIPLSKLPAIQAAALGACDAQDGVKDGVIEDPPRCHFHTEVLLCKGPETDACLTGSQLATLNKLYAGAHTRDGEPVFAGYSPGGEAERAGWRVWVTGPAPEQSLIYMFSTQFFKNMVFNDPQWDFRTFDVDRDTRIADQKMAKYLNANDPDLSRFNARGGKLILYHGWSDAAIAPMATVNYYKRVEGKMGARQMQDFVRLFMVPGLQHCTGGSGPDDFGEYGVANGDAEHSIDAELERWVETGVAPQFVIASMHDAGGKVTRTRPICAYPSVARYKGTGSTNEAQNFACANTGLITSVR